MALQIAYSSRASRDIVNILEYIKRDSHTRARNTARAIEQTIAIVSMMPGLGQSHPNLLPHERQRFVSRHPYRVVFTVDGDELRVLAVIHTARQA